MEYPEFIDTAAREKKKKDAHEKGSGEQQPQGNHVTTTKHTAGWDASIG